MISRSNVSSSRVTRAARRAGPQGLVICVKNEGHEASLERRKIYRVIADPVAEAHRLLRVVDESGEDYLYPRGCFLALTLPRAAHRAVLAAA
jgi:archaellum component FlaG (FlaF/FlaG flagellin family)